MHTRRDLRHGHEAQGRDKLTGAVPATAIADTARTYKGVAEGEPSGVLAKRYGVSAGTVRKWRKRGPEDCLDSS